MLLLPPKSGTCPICAVKHDSVKPHDAMSIYYQYRFYGIRGRWPTWADAVAHCDSAMQQAWQRELRAIGRWTEPKEGEPIADPPAESFHQPIGDIGSRTFGPTSDAKGTA
jgi:hypothetical protein